MKKIVGVLFVAAVLAGGSRAQADPVTVSQGLGPHQRTETLWFSNEDHPSLTSALLELRERSRGWDGDDEGFGAFTSFFEGHPANSAFHVMIDPDGNQWRWWMRENPGKSRLMLAGKLWKAKHLGWEKHRLREGPDPQIAATPEPASLILLGSGVLGVLGVRRRKQQ
jgi:PEP-CTERM motif